MTTDYDLVIIGNTPEGIYAALIAAHLKARVALVQQPSQSQIDGSETIFRSRFTYITHLSQQVRLISSNPLDFSQKSVTTWGEEVKKILAEEKSLAILSAHGVDVILGCGEMVRLPQLGVVIGNRKLRSHAYLLATGSMGKPSTITDLETVGYLTPEKLWYQDKLSFLPQKLVIISATPLGIELAQNLTRIGKKITLVMEGSSILPNEDPEIIKYLQAQLEAEGIEILLDSPVTQAKYIDGKKWLQAGDHAIESEEIILVDSPQPHQEGLNLEGVGIECTARGIKVNQKLQTTNPKIYACGSLLGGYSDIHLATYEAEIAVKNALFIPWFKVNYRHIPYVLLTNPPLARVGMTVSQAQQNYGNKVTILEQQFKTIAQSRILGETTGLCRIVVHNNGEVLGAYIFGAEAGELINLIAFAIKEKLKISKLANLVCPFTTFSEIINKTALQWNQERLEQQKILNNCLKTWLIWRRKWFS
jgi:pyruvate/2-oxoglutarate dehydrogenase complex dihydrolipoamide dehydrogenase (E3) component